VSRDASWFKKRTASPFKFTLTPTMAAAKAFFPLSAPTVRVSGFLIHSTAMGELSAAFAASTAHSIHTPIGRQPGLLPAKLWPF